MSFRYNLSLFLIDTRQTRANAHNSSNDSSAQRRHSVHRPSPILVLRPQPNVITIFHRCAADHERMQVKCWLLRSKAERSDIGIRKLATHEFKQQGCDQRPLD